jgi:hypothetical protein
MSGSNRKFGRNAKRSPSMARYRNENRMAKNKRLAIEKEDRTQSTNAEKRYAKVPGHTRRMKRQDKQRAYHEQRVAA